MQLTKFAKGGRGTLPGQLGLHHVAGAATVLASFRSLSSTIFPAEAPKGFIHTPAWYYRVIKSLFILRSSTSSRPSSPSPVSGSGHTRKEKNPFEAVNLVCKKVRARRGSPPHKWFIVECSSPFMRLAEHITANRAWCRRCLPGR